MIRQSILSSNADIDFDDNEPERHVRSRRMARSGDPCRDARATNFDDKYCMVFNIYLRSNAAKDAQK